MADPLVFCGSLPQNGIAAMPRSKNAVPSDRPHKQSGQAVVTLPAPTANGTDFGHLPLTP